MSKSIGKIFEQNWKASIPEDIFVYRPPDAAQSFQKTNSNLRFSLRSPCDYFIFNGQYLWALELKSVAGTSISFERCNTDKGVIHDYQIKTLKELRTYPNVISGLLIDFRKSCNTYFLSIDHWDQLINSINKKSFTEKNLLDYSSPIWIEKKKLRVNYRYNVIKFLQDSSKAYSDNNE